MVIILENKFWVLNAVTNMKIYPKIARKLQKNHRKLEDVLTCDDDIKNIFRVYGTFKCGNISKMVIKLGKIGGWGSLLVMMLGNIFRVYSGVPNMIIYLNIYCVQCPRQHPIKELLCS